MQPRFYLIGLLLSSLRFITEASRLNLWSFFVLKLIFTWYTATFHLVKVFTVNVALHLRWLTTEKLQNYETVKGGCITSTNEFKTQINNKLRWLASVINFKLLHTGCPIAHAFTAKNRGEWNPPLPLELSGKVGLKSGYMRKSKDTTREW